MTGKRANGEGHVRKRDDGRWEAQVTLPNGKRQSLYRKTQAEANTARINLLHDLGHGIPVVTERQTIGEYLPRWLDMAAHGLAPRTVTRYRSHINGHLVPALGRTRLAKLTAQQIQLLYAAKLQDGYAVGSVRQMHAVLRKALGEAARLGIVPLNVALLVKPPRPARREMQVLSADETRVLLVAVEGDRLEAFYVLAITTGMRLGELLALRWVDIDLHALLHGAAPALHVRVTLRYKNADTYFFEPPKTAKSRRRIGLSTTAIQALEGHRARQAEERHAAGVAWRDEDLVFCTPIGGALCGNHLSDRDFCKLLASAGLPRIRFHDLRHTCATLLLRSGVHPKVVSELLGHSTVAMTLDQYSHVLPDMQQAAMDAMDGLLR